MNENVQQLKDKFIDEVFNQSSLKVEDTSNYSPEEVLVTQEDVDNSINNNPNKDFITTTTLHFHKSPQEIDLNELPKVLSDDASILDIKALDGKKISTIIKIALFSCEDLEPEEVVQKHKDYIENLKKRLKDNSPIDNTAIIGNLVEEPAIAIPKDLIINKPSINQLQNTIELNAIEINEIRKKVYEKLKDDKCRENWKFVISHDDLYNELEKQLHEDLENNSYGIIIIGQIIITSKYFSEKIKSQIPSEKVNESLKSRF